MLQSSTDKDIHMSQATKRIAKKEKLEFLQLQIGSWENEISVIERSKAELERKIGVLKTKILMNSDKISNWE